MLPIIPQTPEKAYFRVKVIPKQPKTEYVETMDDGTIKIRLKAVPEKWKANAELIRYLSDEWGIAKGRIEIISGASDPLKLVRVKE